MALEARTIRIEPGVHRFQAGQGLTADERAACERTIAELDARIAPRVSGQDRAVEAAAEQLFGNLAAERRARNAAEQDAADAIVADGFMIALDGRCRAAVSEAVLRILRFEAPGLSDTFVPKAPQLARLVDRIETEWTIERDRLVRLLATDEIETAVEPPVDMAKLDEWRARAKRIAGKLNASAPYAPPRLLRGASPAARVAAEIAAARTARETEQTRTGEETVR